jgi:hypothetical protein
LVLSALVLFCCTALPADAPRAFADSPALLASNSSAPQPDSTTKSKLPDAPAPNLSASAGTDADASSSSAAVSITPGSASLLNAPIKPAVIRPVESPRQRKIWYALMATGHSAAAFDAWSTRRAVSGGYGTESDPLMRPFAHSGAMYAATQVSPAVMDYLGHRMMVSNHRLMRRFWWLPQVAGASFSFGAGIHNYRVVP